MEILSLNIFNRTLTHKKQKDILLGLALLSPALFCLT